MTPRTLFSAAILAAALVALVLVAGPDIDLPGGDGGSGGERSPSAAPEPDGRDPGPAEPPDSAEQPSNGSGNVAEQPTEPLPEDPDDVLGTDPRSLIRPGNLRRALAILDRERRSREGVFDSLRVAPGRIDTQIKLPKRTINLQIRPDFEIPFRSENEFPNDSFPDFRRRGLGASAVDVTVPARMLRRIDRTRGGSAARDIDYFVISRDSIDFRVGYGAYMRSGPQPRIVILEPDGSLRAIG